jgi:hypothetical protein
MNKKVYVASLPFKATEAELKALFSSYPSSLSRTGNPPNRGALPLWKCRRNGRAGGLLPC